MTGMAYIFAFLLMAVLLTFMALVGLFSLHTYVSVLRAERFSRVFIPDIKAIESVAESVKRVSRRVFGPSLIVVRVSAEVWQETVQRFISDSSVIVVDISEPTESLLWEISRLKPLLKTKCILLGHRTRLREMTAHPREIDRAVCEIIDGHDVLVYSSHSAKSERRFAKALRNRLASIAM